MTPPGPYLVVLPTMAIAWLPIGCSFALMAAEQRTKELFF
jgi:hypothetical protein